MPVLIYIREIWTPNIQAKRKLRTLQAQRLSLKLQEETDRKKADYVRLITYSEERYRKSRWPGRTSITRRDDNRWTKVVIEWIPRYPKILRGRLQTVTYTEYLE